MGFVHRFMNIILGISFLVAVVVFGYIYIFQTKNAGQIQVQNKIVKPAPSSANADELVDKYMKQTKLRLESQQKNAERMLAGDTAKQGLKVEIKETDPALIPEKDQIWGASAPTNETLLDKFNQKINADDDEILRTEQEKKEYARQFIENARKDGYHIVLDDKFNVIKVMPIRKPSNNNTGPQYDQFESTPSN